MNIRIENETKERIPREHVVNHMTRALRAIEGSAVTARVTFSDVNGPKGGADIRCALLVKVPGRPPIRVARVQTTPRLAFDESYAAAVRRLEEMTEHQRDAGRRPRKYFVAKRLLTALSVVAFLAVPLAVFGQGTPPAGDLELKTKKKTTVVAPKPGTSQAAKDAEAVRRESAQRDSLRETAKTPPPSRPNGDVTGGVQSKGIQRELGK